MIYSEATQQGGAVYVSWRAPYTEFLNSDFYDNLANAEGYAGSLSCFMVQILLWYTAIQA